MITSKGYMLKIMKDCEYVILSLVKKSFQCSAK